MMSVLQQIDTTFGTRSSDSPCHADLMTSAPVTTLEAHPFDNTNHDDCLMENVQPTDVLCGRDKHSHAHVGNKRFRKLVMLYRQEYQGATSREQKSLITGKIVSTVTAYGGRFLKQEETTGEWSDVGEQYAREKVSHALRSAKDPNRPKVKKPREVKKHVPTPEEDELFELTYADQQNIFRSLVFKEAKGVASEIKLHGVEALFSDN